MYLYTAYHLNIASEVNCPMMRKASFEPSEADITIRRASLPTVLEDATTERAFFQAKSQCVLAKLSDELGYMMIRNGNEILFDAPNADPSILTAFTISLGLSTILLQRDYLIIHGNTVQFDGKTFILCGKSGAGKSTTTTALIQRGAKVVADDISPIHFDSNSTPWVSPGIPFSKLWPESFELLGLDTDNSHFISSLQAKRYIPLNDDTALKQDQAIDAIVYLSKSDTASEVSASKFNKTDALLTTRHNSYGYRFIVGMDMLPNHFAQATRLADNIPFFHIERPETGNTLASVLESLSELIGINITAPNAATHSL